MALFCMLIFMDVILIDYMKGPQWKPVLLSLIRVILLYSLNYMYSPLV